MCGQHEHVYIILHSRNIEPTQVVRKMRLSPPTIRPAHMSSTYPVAPCLTLLTDEHQPGTDSNLGISIKPNCPSLVGSRECEKVSGARHRV